MSRMKNYFLDQIEALAIVSGYDVNFLLDMWDLEYREGDADFAYFCGVTLERDW